MRTDLFEHREACEQHLLREQPSLHHLHRMIRDGYARQQLVPQGSVEAWTATSLLVILGELPYTMPHSLGPFAIPLAPLRFSSPLPPKTDSKQAGRKWKHLQRRLLRAWQLHRTLSLLSVSNSLPAFSGTKMAGSVSCCRAQPNNHVLHRCSS